MSVGGFEEWFKKEFARENTKFREKQLARYGYSARQPEIDALNADNLLQRETCRALGRLVAELKEEKSAINAEVERLRFHSVLYTSIRAYYLKNREHPHGCYARPLPNGGTVSSAATTEDEYDTSMCKCFAIDAAMQGVK